MPQLPSLAIDGERSSGMTVRTENVTAAVAVANIVKTSFGPVGLDKMLVDDIGDVTISNDGATILKLLEVEHPAAKVLVELAGLQDQEVGDGTTSVVLIAAELLKLAQNLITQEIHPTSIISGYRLACKEACKFIKENLAYTVSELGENTIVNAASTSISSKIIGGQQSEFFSKLAVDAMKRVKSVNAAGKDKYSVKAVNLLKAAGGRASESVFVEGYALNCTVASQAMKTKIQGAKIAFLDFNLQKAKLAMGVKVVINDPEELAAIKERESDITKEKVQKILAAGANVILCTKGIDDLCLKYFVEAGAMAVRRCKKEDLRRIAKATGGEIVLSMSNLDGEESFDASSLGDAEEVVQEKVADDELILLKGFKSEQSSSIILRGPNYYMLEEMERSLHDALCVVKRTLESKTVVAGGGSVEVASSLHLEKYSRTITSREQLAIATFAEALLVIPKTLSINAAQDATELLSNLKAKHTSLENKAFGLDLVEGVVKDNIKAGVLEPTMSKIKCIKFATEAAITILRIDEMIKLNPAPEPDHPEH